MFNNVYARVMAAAAVALATVGLRRPMVSGAPTVAHAPELPRATTRPRAERNKPRRRRIRGSSSFKPNGVQERARRVRQIAAGTLTRSNGLVIPSGAASAEWRRNVYNYGIATRA